MLLILLLSGCTGAAETGGQGFDESRPDDTPPDDTRPAGDDTSSSSDDTQAQGDDTDDPDTAWTMPDRPDTSSPSSSSSWRYGGGADYPDVVDPTWPVVTVVGTADELESALGGAVAGDVVYVADGASIDLTGASLCIPGGVWLAGGRGVDGAPGGLITTSEISKTPILKPCGDDVRITGLRIFGADPDECPGAWPDECTGDVEGDSNCRDCVPASYGIVADEVARFEVDNCELSGWSFAAIVLRDGADHAIHHNHIHHTWRQGLGYGVALYGGESVVTTASIHHNRFDYNRHAVAGSGFSEQDYDVHHNLALEHANGHVFDMHGEDEAMDNGSDVAGGDLRVRENTVLVADQYTFIVRGKPAHGAWLYDNCLARGSASDAAKQTLYTGNFYVDEDPDGASAPNTYGQTAGDCETVRWCAASAVVGPLDYLNASSYGLGSLALADLDGDGIDDVIRTSGGAWYWSERATGGWAERRADPLTLADLAFGDFDGDGADDAFQADGASWKISSGASSDWQTWNTSSWTLDRVAFADLDGDGRTDVIAADSGGLKFSSGGNTSWQTLRTDVTSLDAIGFGDFDGDGIDDAFQTTGSAWRFASGGSGDWQDLNTSGVARSSLALVDVDGDGVTDALRASGNTWQISWSGSGSWQTLRITSAGLDDVGFGELDGRPGVDGFVTGCL